ncbi:HlyD family secretion protein [Altererythrobacter sp. CC-YST694]|uniref:HlyD family secretion protein n=1 Tax=Altererythrobacter sp. CC-YST694 TaxID=2755038 RepID=UPI001D0208F9|nr:HlyD family secretion protein [Altererythrobacter sp. CC-YST694]
MTSPTAEDLGADDAASVTEPKQSPFKRRGVRIVLLGVGIVALVLGASWFANFWMVGRYQQSTDDAYVQADAVIVAPKVAGYVEKVFVADNQAVKAGDALFSIDPRDYRSQVAQAQAQIDVAKASAEGLRAQIAEQLAAVDGARARLVSAESDLRFAKIIRDRYEALAATGAESRETFAEKRSQYERAEAALAARKADLVSAQRRVATLQAQIAQAGAQAEGSQAQRAAAEVDLGFTVVRASIAGRIGNKTVQPGQFLQPGARTMSIVPLEQLYITANFKETQVGLMRPGQPVKIEVDALEGVELHGKVESFAPGTGAQFSLLPPENATGNFTKIVQRIPVRIAVDAGPETRALLLPGMSVHVSVDTRSAKDALKKIEREQKALEQAKK